MTEVSLMIPTARGVGTRYIQGYLDFLLLKKQAKYTFKRKKIASEILRMKMIPKLSVMKWQQLRLCLFHLMKHIANIVMVYLLNKITYSNTFLKLNIMILLFMRAVSL